MFSAVGFQGRRKSFTGFEERTAATAPVSSAARMKAWSQWASIQPSRRRLTTAKSTMRPTPSVALPPSQGATSTSTR